MTDNGLKFSSLLNMKNVVRLVELHKRSLDWTGSIRQIFNDQGVTLNLLNQSRTTYDQCATKQIIKKTKSSVL